MWHGHLARGGGVYAAADEQTLAPPGAARARSWLEGECPHEPSSVARKDAV